MINSSNIIGISGFARTGKDALASILQKILSQGGFPTKITSFAYALKEEVDPFLKSKLNISAFTEDPEEKEIVRPLLVCWGTEIIRNQIDMSYWVNKISKTCKENQEKGVKTIIPDVRFDNEVEWIHQQGGTTIYIEREGVKPINNDEKVYTKKLKKMCKFSFFWDNLQDFDHTGPEEVKKFLNDTQSN